MSIYDQISIRIIKEQEMIIGPVAWEEAKKVPGLKVLDKNAGTVEVDDNASEVVSSLVKQYTRLFGQASVEVCKDAVSDLVAELPEDQVPAALK